MGSKALDLPESRTQTLFLRLLWGLYCRGSIFSNDEVHSARLMTESGLKILLLCFLLLSLCRSQRIMFAFLNVYRSCPTGPLILGLPPS